MSKLVSTLILVISMNCSAQYNWQWTEMDTMPMRTSNNAMCEAQVGGMEYVYSFGGIDETKLYSGIHQNSFKFDFQSNSWSTIASLPDTLGKIAASASYVKDKIYIIGGYHVLQGNGEVSSNKVHIYNPVTEVYESDGTPIPLAIDDHVQCVYKDSLIYIVTGWSNTTNYPNVQIYNPSLDTWISGTSVPNTGYFKSFGSSGYIIGDTLYYHGGVTTGNFTAQNFMRKGFIDPNDPTNITWTLMNDAPGNAGYRSACSGIGNTVFWVGGAPTAYNYDGIAYDGSGGVDPSARILHFNNWNYQHVDAINEPHGVMDLRGIADLGNSRWIICGGMDTNQVVSNRTFLLENNLVNTEKVVNVSFEIRYLDDVVIIKSEEIGQGSLIDGEGKTILKFESSNVFRISKTSVNAGIYFFVQNNSNIKILL